MNRWRLGIISVIIIVVWFLWDLISPGDRLDPATSCGGNLGDFLRCPASFAALHTVVAGTLQTVLVVVAAWAFFNRKLAHREALLSDSTVSIGLAGSVLPLLTVASVMAWLATPEPIDPTTPAVGKRPKTEPLSYLAMARKAAEGEPTRGALKWARSLVKPGTWPNMQQLSLAPALVTESEANLVDEAIRQLVGTVRDWASMFGASDLGRQSAHLVQSLRREAQELELAMRSFAAAEAGAPDIHQLDELRLTVLEWALVLQVAFEDASRPISRRPEVDAALKLAAQMPAAQRLAEYLGQSACLDQASRAAVARKWLATQSGRLTG